MQAVSSSSYFADTRDSGFTTIRDVEEEEDSDSSASVDVEVEVEEDEDSDYSAGVDVEEEEDPHSSDGVDGEEEEDSDYASSGDDESPYSRRRPQKPHRPPSRSDPTGLCVICKDEEANMAGDCGHLAMCKECSDQIMAGSRQCPLCRRRIEQPRQIYKS